MKSQSKYMILLVDDDAAVLTVLQHSLSLAGHEILVAADGADALAHYEQDCADLDLLITDVQMPNIDGLELARRLRARCPDLPIIFISGGADEDTMARMATVPNHRFLAKPFIPSQLVAAVRLILANL